MNSPRSPVAGFRLCPLVTPPTTSLCSSSSNRQLQGRDPLPLHLPIYLPLCMTVWVYIKAASGSVLALLSRPDSYYCIVFLFLFFSFCYIFSFFLWFVFVYALKCLPWTHARLGERKSRWERADNIDNVWRGRGRERGRDRGKGSWVAMPMRVVSSRDRPLVEQTDRDRP